jgi:acyl-CoA thioesterase-1
MKNRFYLFSFFLVFLCLPLSGKSDPFTKPFDNPVDDPKLPRVLIIGDSISIGYTPRVRKLLDGKANVHRPKTNCRWSAFGDENVLLWIGEEKWDLIHFNFGLWDWYGWKQNKKATAQSYAKSLEGIVQQLKSSGAKLVFAVTTPPCIGPEKKVQFIVEDERAEKFNRSALAVMKKYGVAINDLYSLIGKDRAKYQLGANDVHYNDAGRDLLAAQVSKLITKELSQ